MSPFLLGLIWNFVISLVIVSFVWLISMVKKRVLWKVDKLVALSVWLILSIVFLGFIPEVFSHSDIEPHTIGMLLLGGILLFYVLELFMHWHHCKDLSEDGHSHHDHEHENSPLIAFGTFFDNFIHGVVLYSAFSVDIAFGIVTTFAVLTHTIPQNVANLLMNHKDTQYVYIAATGGILWALLIYPFQDFLTHYTFHILAIIAGWLLYTAMSDILPSFTKKSATKEKVTYLMIMMIGISLFFLTQTLVWEHSHDAHGHEDEHHHEEEHHHGFLWSEYGDVYS